MAFAYLLHLAPMQGYTNKHLRYFVRLLSEKAVLWTEMEKTEDLLRSDKDSKKRLLHSDEEHPLVLQLGGDDPLAMQRLMQREVRLYGPFDEININAGCPSIQAGGASYGASLMLRADRTRELVETLAHERQQPVSVKCRIGTYPLPQEEYNDDYNTLHEFAYAVSKSNCLDHIIVHARAAVLAGLSPSKNRNVPPLRYDFVHRLAKDFPSLRVTINGGLSLKQVLASSSISSSSSSNNNKDIDLFLDHNLDVMVGRDGLSKILDLWHVDANNHVEHWHHRISKENTSSNKKSKATTRAIAIKQYGEYAARQLEEDASIVLAELLLPLILACEHLRELVEEQDDEVGGREEEKQGREAMCDVEDDVEACCSVVEAILAKGCNKDSSSSSNININSNSISITSKNEGRRRRGDVKNIEVEGEEAEEEEEEAASTSRDMQGELKRVLRRTKAAIGTKVMNKIIRNREK